MKKNNTVLSAVLLAASLVSTQAALYDFTSELTGSQEVPPNNSPATGSLLATLDTTAHTLTYTISFSGLLGPLSNAHYHDAPPGVSGPVVLPIPLGAAAGDTSGVLDDSLSTTSVVVLTPSEFEQALLDGNIYANLHSTVFPAGEIRGQLELVGAVPEPSMFAATGAFLALAFCGWRARK